MESCGNNNTVSVEWKWENFIEASIHWRLSKDFWRYSIWIPNWESTFSKWSLEITHLWSSDMKLYRKMNRFWLNRPEFQQNVDLRHLSVWLCNQRSNLTLKQRVAQEFPSTMHSPLCFWIKFFNRYSFSYVNGSQTSYVVRHLNKLLSLIVICLTVLDERFQFLDEQFNFCDFPNVAQQINGIGKFRYKCIERISIFSNGWCFK